MAFESSITSLTFTVCRKERTLEVFYQFVNRCTVDNGLAGELF